MNEQEILEAMFEWERLCSNQENKVLYVARMKFLQDQLSNLMGESRAGKEEGRNEGRREGRQEGIKEGITQLVRKMAEKGMPPIEIAKMTGLQEEVVMEMLRQG